MGWWHLVWTARHSPRRAAKTPLAWTTAAPRPSPSPTSRSRTRTPPTWRTGRTRQRSSSSTSRTRRTWATTASGRTVFDPTLPTPAPCCHTQEYTDEERVCADWCVSGRPTQKSHAHAYVVIMQRMTRSTHACVRVSVSADSEMETSSFWTGSCRLSPSVFEATFFFPCSNFPVLNQKLRETLPFPHPPSPTH